MKFKIVPYFIGALSGFFGSIFWFFWLLGLMSGGDQEWWQFSLLLASSALVFAVPFYIGCWFSGLFD
jgi:hypothetical protein